MLKKIMAAIGLLLVTASAQAMLYIDNLAFTSSRISFDLTGTVDSVGSSGSRSFFFGFVGKPTTWMTTNIATAGGVSNDGNAILFADGFNDIDPYGDYVFARGSQILTVGDTVDWSLWFEGNFELTGFDVMDFSVQVGWDTDSNLLEAALVSGGVRSLAQEIPEPTSGALFGLALAGLGVLYRRKTV